MPGLKTENCWGLRLTTRRGNAPARAGPVGGPSQKWYCVVRVYVVYGMVCMGLQVLSLLVEEGRSTFGVMAGFWTKF